MISTVSRCLRSKKIHIGMDESFGVGEGGYRRHFVYKHPTKVVSRVSSLFLIIILLMEIKRRLIIGLIFFCFLVGFGDEVVYGSFETGQSDL
jgi:hypothetical protein